MSFQKLGLSDELLKAIEELKYTTPSPIQEKAIPVILEGKDVIASAQTGTGKTAGFMLPILQLIKGETSSHRRRIKALILTPTRELAAQIQDNTIQFAKHCNLTSTVIYGGVNQAPQVRTLKQGVDILIATPGRLLDLYNQKLLKLSDIEILVLDEADRMLDMGFQRDIYKIIDLLPTKRQNLLFSATFSKAIKRLAHGLLVDPVQVEATPENTTVEKIEQTLYRVDRKRKTELLETLINSENWQQALVFTRTKHGANKLSMKLVKSGITSAAIHGNKTQNARMAALHGFKTNKVRILVATDIAARGLDIPLLPHVVNFELPNVPEDYVHRIGRTGRANTSGVAISLVEKDELPYVRDIERLIDNKFKLQVYPGFELGEEELEQTTKEAPRQTQKSNQRSSAKPKRRPNGESRNAFGKKPGNRSNFKRKSNKKTNK